MIPPLINSFSSLITKTYVKIIKINIKLYNNKLSVYVSLYNKLFEMSYRACLYFFNALGQGNDKM
jgi:hypothetical protein